MWLALPFATIIDLLGRIFSPKKSPLVNRYRTYAVCVDNNYSVKRAQDELKYTPQYSTLEGLKKTANWYLKQHEQG